MTDEELRNKNADLGNKIHEILQNHPELWDVADEIALKQGMWVQVGISFSNASNSTCKSERET